MTADDVPVAELDVAVVGAGFAGLYAVHRPRELGLRVRAFERGVGGTLAMIPASPEAGGGRPALGRVPELAGTVLRSGVAKRYSPTCMVSPQVSP